MLAETCGRCEGGPCSGSCCDLCDATVLATALAVAARRILGIQSEFFAPYLAGSLRVLTEVLLKSYDEDSGDDEDGNDDDEHSTTTVHPSVC